MNMRKTIINRIENAADLPTLPNVALKINDMIGRDDTSANDVARVMEQDPALTARVLRVANSAAFGAVTPAVSVPSAIARLGLREVRHLVFSISVIGAFKSTAGVDHRRFWKHSLCTAFAARIMLEYAAKLQGGGNDDLLFTSGILHDTGVLLLDLYASEIYRQVAQTARNADEDLYAAELRELGTNHAEAGALLLQRWRLPPAIVQAVRWHHEPCRCADVTVQPVAQLVHLANFVCNNQGIDNGLSGFPVKFSEAAWFDTGLDEKHVPEIIQRVNASVAKSEVLTDVAGAPR